MNRRKIPLFLRSYIEVELQGPKVLAERKLIPQMANIAQSKTTEPDSDNSLAVWLRLQRSLAEKNGIALTTLTRDGAAIGRIENDNSICRAMRVKVVIAMPFFSASDR